MRSCSAAARAHVSHVLRYGAGKGADPLSSVARCVKVDQIPGSTAYFSVQVMSYGRWFNLLRKVNSTGYVQIPIDDLYLFADAHEGPAGVGAGREVTESVTALVVTIRVSR